ncbi:MULTISPECIES: hypothetical protein [unclassified Streptomyces]|uniref:hypothetical protein n=1 Tax=unclassified Streptomyces TaxID=2593676 RepID=UPI0029B68726|nr:MULTISPECIES: hypothetical protein [unclassified Streptomyces]MDX3766442.1 hypothetical protein [Streptomyces sp. AK08-01B]MDX3816301.1 hypothetical protein [Streptomyces sp. AK08-01A]
MTTSTLMPMPPHPGLNITETVERHDVDGAQLRDALDRINRALAKAWDVEHYGLTQEQFTQLVCHCFYNTLLDDALVHTLHAATISPTRSVTCLTFRIDELITTELDA